MSEPTEAEERKYRMWKYARNVTNSAHYHAERLVPSEAWLSGYFAQVVEHECSFLMRALAETRVENWQLRQRVRELEERK